MANRNRSKTCLVLVFAAFALIAALPNVDAFPDPNGHVRVVIDNDRSWWYDCTYHIGLNAHDVECAVG